MELKARAFARMPEIAYYDPYLQRVGGFKIKGNLSDFVDYLFEVVSNEELQILGLGVKDVEKLRTSKEEYKRTFLRSLNEGGTYLLTLSDIFWYLFPTSEKNVFRIEGYTQLTEDLPERAKEGEAELKRIFSKVGFKILEEIDISYF